MEQLVRLKQLRIKKDMLLLTLGEKRQIRTRTLLYLGIFILLFIGMAILDPNPNSADAGDSFNDNAAGFLNSLQVNF